MNPAARTYMPLEARSPSTPSTAPSTPVTAILWYDAPDNNSPGRTGSRLTDWGSPIPKATRSATMPAKASWSPDPPLSIGLGLCFGGSPLLEVKKQLSFTSTTSSTSDQIQHSPDTFNTLSKTYPLMQQGFDTPRKIADQPRLHPNLPDIDATSELTMKPDNISTTRVQLPGPWPSPTDPNDRLLAISTLSPHYLETYPELANVPTPVFKQSNHPQGFKRLTHAPNARVEEAFEGAHEIVRGLNPDYFPMPFGTRVVNIKTDHVANMHIAVQRGVWSTLDKVSRRIMVVWNARQSSEEKVLLLFAINGSKNYCGLAEMSGSYDPDSSVEGWQGHGCSGSIPLTWLYVKNVPYTNVSHILQLHNNQPVVNMWNGMKITSDTARKVVEVYVQTPHFSNILAWLEGTGNRAHARVRAQSSNHNFHNGRSSMAVQSGQGDRRSSQAAATSKWCTETNAHNNVQAQQEQQQEQITPTHQPPSAPRAMAAAATPPQFGRPTMSASPAVINIPCIMNADGSYTVVGDRFNTGQQGHDNSTHQRQLPAFPMQAAQSISDFRGGSVSRHRGSTPARGGMRGGMANAIQLRGTRSFPTVLESDFDRFRNHASDMPAASGMQPPTDMMSTPKPINITNSHFDFRRDPQHARSADTLGATDNSRFTHLGHPASATLTHGDITPLAHHPDPFAGNNEQRRHTRNKSQASQSSYPKSMEDADSLAGYKPIHRMPQLRRSKDSSILQASRTPTITPHQAHLPSATSEWNETAVSDLSRPKEQKSSFYPTTVDRIVSVSGSDKSSRSIKSQLSLRQQAEYYRILAEKAEYEANMNERLARLGIVDGSFRGVVEGSFKPPRIPGPSSDTSSRPRTAGSSDVGSFVETSSIEQYNVSPVRNKAGNVLRSVSKSKKGRSTHGKPTLAGLRARESPYHDSWDSNVKRSVEKLVASPASSVGNNIHTSPPRISSDGGSSHTNGPSGGINLQY